MTKKKSSVISSCWGEFIFSKRLATRTFLFFLLFFSVVSIRAQSLEYCIPGRFSEVPCFDSSAIRIDSNLLFAWPENYFSQAIDSLKMDIYYPDLTADTLGKRPFILLIHGGAFLAGARTDMNYLCMEFARRGFVTATIDYRLGWDCSATDIFNICILCSGLNYNLVTATYCAVQDSRAAMRYISVNAPQYEIDTSYLFIGGESAGSLTALHTTFWDQQEANAFAGNTVNLVGSLDTVGNPLNNTFTIKGVINSCGGVNKDSIILNNGNIPVINFADDGDCIVPPGYGQVISCFCQPFYWSAGSTVIYNLLTSNAVCSQYYQVPLSTNHCSFPKPELVKKASCFLKSVFCGSCQSLFSTDPYAAVSCSAMSGINDNPAVQPYYNIVTDQDNGELTITLIAPAEDNYCILISNVLGQNIYKSSIQKGYSNLTFSTSFMPDGIYFVSIYNDQISSSRKFLIRH
jgi:hypothetical protein